MKSGKLKGILWHQGEHDATPELAPKWGPKFKSVIESFIKEFGDVPFVAGELGPYLENFRGKKDGRRILWKAINSQLHELKGKVPGYSVVSSESLVDKGDKLHFNTESLRKLGRRYADVILSLGK